MDYEVHPWGWTRHDKTGCKIIVRTPDEKEADPFGVDACVLYEISRLWEQDIKTLCSCCGHGKKAAVIGVPPESVAQMEALGYERGEPLYLHCGPDCVEHWFKAKSELVCKGVDGNV